jgi:methionyl-tRNA synthetase
MREINPTIAVGKGDFRGGKVSPEDLEALGEKVKQKVTVVEGFNNMAPAELAAAANDACRTADDFKEALKARANQVANPKTKKALNDGAALIAKRNEELAEAGRQHLADPDNKQKQQQLATACQNMKDAVDEVLGRVRPRVTLTDPNAVRVGDVKPSDLEVTCDEVIAACTDLQGFRNDSPEETRDKGDDTSRKAAK